MRCVDVDAHISNEYGIYNCLYDVNNGAEFSNLLKRNCEECYGVPAEEFIKYLTTNNTCDNLKESIENELNERYSELFTKFELKGSDGQIQRVAEIFALYIATGCLACRAGVLCHTEDQIIESINYVFEKVFKERGKQPFEEAGILDALHDFLLQNESRFKTTGHIEDKPVNNCLGYKEEDETKTVYRVIPTLFKEEFCIDRLGINYKTLRRILIKEDILMVYEDGKDKQYTSSDGSKRRLITIAFKKY